MFLYFIDMTLYVIEVQSEIDKFKSSPKLLRSVARL